MGDSTLREKSSSVTNFRPSELKHLVLDLSDTYYEATVKYHYCRGIAAPQIGFLKRAIFIDDPRFKGPLMNPRIVFASSQIHEVWDSCLSLNLAFFVQIARHDSVRVEFFDADGAERIILAD